MTSHNDEIHNLIADIDNLLNSSGKRLSRLLSGQAQEPRVVLERIRSFLVNLQETETSEVVEPNQSVGYAHQSPLLLKFAGQAQNQSTAPPSPGQQEQTQAITEQLKNELSAFMQPMKAEISALLQERTLLEQEIRQLEQKRLHNYSLSQQLANQEQIITDFLQVLMSRLVPTLKSQLAEVIVNKPDYALDSNQTSVEITPPTHQIFWESSAQTERLAQVAQELDQKLLSLDGTVNVVFDALQRNIHTYHESLSQALARMHSTGLQGEQLLVSWLQNLTQELSSFQPSQVDAANQTLAKLLSCSQPDSNVTQGLSSANDTSFTVSESLSIDSEALSTDKNIPETGALPIVKDQVFSTEIESIVEDSFDTANQESAIVELPLVNDGVLPSDADQVLEDSLDTATDESATVELPIVNDEVLPREGDRILEDSRNTATDELDEMLLQLGVDESFPADNLTNSTTVSQDGLPLTNNDEVDIIYASLFGNNLEIKPESVTEDLLSLNYADTQPPSNPLTEADTAAMMPDAWFDQSDADIFAHPDLSTISDTPIPPTDALFFEEATQSPDVDLENLPSTEIDSIQPNSRDTITSLTDLLADVEVKAPLLTVDSPVEEVKKTTVVTIESKPPSVTRNKKNEQPQQPTEEFIPASPQENLLSSEVAELANLPEISLNEEQWRKLHQDLAQLDEQPSQSQPVIASDSADFWVSDGRRSVSESSTTGGDRQQHLTPEVTASSNHVALPAPEVSSVNQISAPQTQTSLEVTPATEKKKEATIDTPEAAVVTPGSTINNTADAPDTLDSLWYLGIDLGTTGISAALLNRSTGVVYPICWSAEHQPGDNSFQQSFRLPAEVYLPTTSAPPGDTDSSQTPEHLKNHPYSAQLKPYLQVAIPYKNQQQKWEPVLQFNQFCAGPLIWVVRSLSKLLLTLKADRYSTTQGLIATAIGLDQHSFQSIINNVAGVICNCPSSWSEQYRFNVREALLTSKLVQHPQQVFFVEEAIASLLSILDGANGETVQLSSPQGLIPAKINDHSLVGNTLVINLGASHTEMGLLDVPDNLLELTHNHFMLHSFAYASKAIEQDIICQLLLPPKYRQSRWEKSEDSLPISSHPWPSAVTGLDQIQWQSLELDELELPRVAEPDIQARICFQQRLESSLLGQALLDAALALKLILQHQDTFSFELADQRWVLQRRDLESQVFVPFVRRLNRELNKLLVARGIPTEAINQAILTGGLAHLGVVNRWVRQKLPSAKIIPDAYFGENGAPNCSRVAYGLALLPLHPQVLEESRHQYTDYFLFTELLRLLPNRTLAFSEVLQLFEGRGINTSICQQRLLAFLEGEIPSGLIPAQPEATWLTHNSEANPDYQAIASVPLFEKQGNLNYRPNFAQLQIFHRYLDAIKASTQQSLDEPYTINFSLVEV
ncbi:hypothetical protein [Anabaena sp. CA = ATCC 33047]|uniref:hypothetical protein n=1 Tax=Anabaena sp. (strain CA / ATCC 33047) TaxID=52271 RepID=UPI00082FB036|nr:hypothetical protein [Anabaena sp. CA = ATCC 33047]